MAGQGDSWLELLLRDASAEQLEEHRQGLLHAGAPVESVDAEARRALQLQAQLRDRSRRATELAVLSEIASKLSSVRDLPALLGDIAVQARQLLRTEVAYLALVEDDALRIRFFAGVLGLAAREIRLSLTAGLAGRIMTTGQAQWTSDYLADTSIEHQAAADSFAGEEQLHSILGVPLRAHGTAFGVLFAAERSVRPFSDSEISLLSGLAGHAAVAIENARLFDAERARTVELRETNELLHLGAAAVDRAIILHERLTEAVVRGGGPAEVVQALSDVLKAPVQLVDSDDRALAGPELGAPSPSERFVGGDRGVVVVPGEGDEILVLCPVVAAEDYLGSLVVRGHGTADDAEIRLLERGALGIALSLVQQRALTDAATRSRGELLTALVEGGESDTLERRALAARIDLRKEHFLALTDATDAAGRSACAELARQHDGLVVDRAGRTLLLVPADTDLSPLRGQVTVGVSGPAQGAAALPEAYAEARRCLQALLALGKSGIVASSQELGVYGFLLAPAGPAEAAEFVRRTVGPLLEHDLAKGTDLARTLEEYLASGRQHTATAETLHIHPNTLYQRLTRIGAVLGEQWREPDSALDLHVALRLHRLAADLG